MAYYLTIQKRKGEYQELNIKDLPQFNRISRNVNGYSLEEIDNFTSRFYDEVDLKNVLYNAGIIELDDIVKDISIRYKKDNDLKKVRYDLVYYGMHKFLDCFYLRNMIFSFSEDKEFLKKLVSSYGGNPFNAYIISNIKSYLEFNYISGDYIYNLLNSFIENEIYSYDKTGNETLKYKSLHDLAMFVYNYIHNKELSNSGITKKMDNDNKKKKLLELQHDKLISSLCVVERPKAKRLTKKEIQNIPVDGQISFFD